MKNCKGMNKGIAYLFPYFFRQVKSSVEVDFGAATDKTVLNAYVSQNNSNISLLVRDTE